MSRGEWRHRIDGLHRRERCGSLSTDEIFCLWKEKIDHLLCSSVCVPSIALSSRIDFFFHIFLFQFFVVDRLSEMSCRQKRQLSNHVFIRQVEKSMRNSTFPELRLFLNSSQLKQFCLPFLQNIIKLLYYYLLDNHFKHLSLSDNTLNIHSFILNEWIGKDLYLTSVWIINVWLLMWTSTVVSVCVCVCVGFNPHSGHGFCRMDADSSSGQLTWQNVGSMSAK